MTLAPITRDLISLRDAMDRLFEESFISPRRFFGPEWPEGSAFAADLRETTDAYVLTAAVPGVKPEDIRINATPDGVTVKGEYKAETEVKEASYLRRERRFGEFERSFTVPVPIEPDKVTATQDNGVLTLTMPKSEKVKPKAIQVKVGR